MSVPRSVAFQQLKPACVLLSQIALQFKAGATSDRQVVQAIQTLLDALQRIAYFDQKLADYVFFPLHFVLGDSSKLSSTAVSSALKCLHKLIVDGWNTHASPDLCKQLISLLSVLCTGGQTVVKRLVVEEEISLTALDCLKALLTHARDGVTSLCNAAEAESVPVLGFVLDTLLTACTEPLSNQCQLLGLQATESLILHIESEQILRQFLPGIISSLTKVLQPAIHGRKPYRNIVTGLNIVSNILRKTLGDATRGQALQVSESAPYSVDPGLQETDPWIKASSAQVKLALANVVKLRDHQRPEVLDALYQLCIIVVGSCKSALKSSVSLMLETALVISSHEAAAGLSKRQLDLEYLVVADNALADHLKASLFDWLSTLPRVLESPDESKHKQVIAQIDISLKIIENLGLNTAPLLDALSQSFQESVMVLMKITDLQKISSAQGSMDNQSLALALTTTAENTSRHFDTLPIAGKSDNVSLLSMQKLVQGLGSSSLKMSLGHAFLDGLEGVTGKTQLAYLWLLSRLIGQHFASHDDLGQYLEISDDTDVAFEDVSEAVYTRALDILSSPFIDDAQDWRVEAMALEILALRSCQQKRDFRPELVDALYPVTERIGSTNTLLRRHAMTALNIISRACGYANSGDGIVQNVDYLVNSIALKFNTFDISPQAPRVLIMMIQLCGPALLPFLDDLVDAIFSVLASYHGYERLVDSLFAVLSSIVEHASSSSSHLIERPAINHKKSPRQSIGMSEVIAAIRAVSCVKDNGVSKSRSPRIESEDVSDLHEEEENASGDGKSQMQQHTTESADQKPSKTYQMVQSIVRLGQHYLTHESAMLRARLLQLLVTSCSALQRNENEFLPLINDVWPVVIKRIYDSEAFVSITAMKAVSTIVQGAGDFMSMRLEDEWKEICALYKRTQRSMEAEKKGKGGRGSYAHAYKLWDAMVDMLTQLAMHVRMTAEMEDDLVDLLGKYCSVRPELREALEVINADAVWLEMEKQKAQQEEYSARRKPQLEGYTFAHAVF